jgi:hypothetical protein
LKVVHQIVVSSADTIGAFHPGFDAVNLHRPTDVVAVSAAVEKTKRRHGVAAQFEIASDV